METVWRAVTMRYSRGMSEAHALLVGVPDPSIGEELRREGFRVSQVSSAPEVLPAPGVDVVILGLTAERPLETYSVTRSAVPDTPIVVLTEPGREGDGEAAVRAGAEEHLARDSIPSSLLPRILRYVIDQHRIRRELRELEVTDVLTGLPNLRGFLPVAEHHFRIADRARRPVVLLFVQLDEVEEVRTELGVVAAEELVLDAAQVILDGVRDADYPARVTDDTFCILLTGEGGGAEAVVLSRLVESIAVRGARGDRLRPLSLSIGSALYHPEHPASIEGIIETARRRMAEQRHAEEPDPSEAP